MGTIPIIVEGSVDKAIIESYVERTRSEISLKFSIMNGKNELLRGVDSAIAVLPPGTLCVAEDIDMGSVDQLQEKYRNSLSARYSNVVNNGNIFTVDDNRLFLIPMGLENNPTIAQFRFNQHLVEDHVVAILMQDNDIVNSLSHGRVTNSAQLISALTAMSQTQSGLGFPIQSCKEILDLAMSIMRYCTHPAAFASRVIANADLAVVEGSMPQIAQIVREL